MQSKTHFENAQRQAQEIPMLKELRDRLLSEIPKLESAYKSAMEAQALRKRAAALELEREQVKACRSKRKPQKGRRRKHSQRGSVPGTFKAGNRADSHPVYKIPDAV